MLPASGWKIRKIADTSRSSFLLHTKVRPNFKTTLGKTTAYLCVVRVAATSQNCISLKGLVFL
jgi:hypothetical protein